MFKSKLKIGRAKLAGIYHGIAGYPMVYDALGGIRKHRKRALLVYLVKPFLLNTESHKVRFRRHQNWWQNLEIAKILDAFGYIVDVIDYQDHRRTFRDGYDLLIGMGLASCRVAKSLPGSIPKIYIGTGSETEFNNEKELDRLAGVAFRRGCHLKPRRIARFKSSELKYFDFIFCFGNEFTAATFRKCHDRVYTFNNHGFPDMPFYEKDFESAKYSFLYFSSLGQVHKGLDLLLEVFPHHPKLHLYVCGSFEMETDFVKCYKKELFYTPNIHPIGYIKVPSEDFKYVCKKCAYAILPSCAEGQSGSMVVCMHAGLIPIVSKECGIDTNGFGITLNSCNIDDIANTIEKVVKNFSEWHKTKSNYTRQVALKYYSEEAFRKRLKEILNQSLLTERVKEH